MASTAACSSREIALADPTGPRTEPLSTAAASAAQVEALHAEVVALKENLMELIEVAGRGNTR